MNCKHLRGRKRSICDGTSGLSPEKEEAYRKLFAKRRGWRLGDKVQNAIRILTLGTINPKPGCGCEKRKRWLNSL